MNNLFVADFSLISEAEELANFTKQFIPVTKVCPDMAYYLHLDKKGLALISREFGTVYINEIYAKFIPRLKNPYAELLVQAVKLNKTTLQIISQSENRSSLIGDKDIVVWDLTAGLGLDASLIASCGYQVILIEQNPFLATLLYYAWIKNLIPKYNTKVVYAHSQEFIAQVNEPPHIIYLDPMFKDQKSAKSKKNMQIIQALTHNKIPAQEQDLFHISYLKSPNKIVVKRDNKQANLVDFPLPSYAKFGTTIRYDIYNII